MKKITIFLNLLLTFTTLCLGQEDADNNLPKAKNAYHIDFLMGPYLFIEHLPYESVLMYGARLGYEWPSKITATLEYTAGQQDDDFNTLGLTHNVNIRAEYYFKGSNTPIRPYAFLGGGMIEFKSFEVDDYGIIYQAGLGMEANVSARIKGLIEPRYMNTANIDPNAQNQIAVMWGIRMLF